MLRTLILATMVTLALTFPEAHVLPEDLRDRYAAWKSKFYPTGGLSTLAVDTASESQRLKTWEKNVRAMDKHNANPNTSYQEGENQFTAMTDDEIIRTETGLDRSDAPSDEAKFLGQFVPEGAELTYLAESTTLSAQKEFAWDWVAKGAVPAIRSQGACGSCWAFAAISASESAFKIAGGKLYDISEQHMVDCSTKDNGCGGGWMSNTYNYLKTVGVVEEANYPYKARNGSCAYSSSKAIPDYKHTGYTSVPGKNENEMKHAVAKQPVTVAVCAKGWGSYASGVFDNASACNGGLNHGVVIVGYGEEGGTDFWLIRNSWGTGWGDKGYMKIKRNTGGAGMCKIASYGYYPNVTVPAAPKPDPKPEPKPTPTPTPTPTDCKTPFSNHSCFHKWVKDLQKKYIWMAQDGLSQTTAENMELAGELGKVKYQFEASLQEDDN